MRDRIVLYGIVLLTFSYSRLMNEVNLKGNKALVGLWRKSEIGHCNEGNSVGVRSGTMSLLMSYSTLCDSF